VCRLQEGHCRCEEGEEGLEEAPTLVLELREVGEAVDLRGQGGEGVSEARRGNSKDAKVKILGRPKDCLANEDPVVVADRVRWSGLGSGPEHDLTQCR
jgi:hypothetical protein